MTLDLTDEEVTALALYLRRKLDDERFPAAPRLDPLKTILAKLEPSTLDLSGPACAWASLARFRGALAQSVAR